MTTDNRPRELPLALIAIGVVIVLQVLGIVLQAVVLNPTTQSNQTALNSQGTEIRAVACAQAESTANAFRFRQIGPNGKTESRDHFVTRMLAQQHTLEAAQHIGCTSAKGFPPFEKQVARALHEISVIIGADHTHRPTSAASKPGSPDTSPVRTAAPGGDATSAQTGSSQPGRHEGGSGGSEETHQPAHHHQAPVSGEQGSGGEGVPSTPPTKEASSTSSQSSSSQTTERVESTSVEKASPEAAAPVGGAVGGVVEEAGAAVGGTVEGVEATTCSLAKVLCHE